MTVGVILAAGKGVRAYPATKHMPKVMMEIAGKSLLERNLELMVGYLALDEIVIVIGHLGTQIQSFIGDTFQGVNVQYALQEEQRGIGDALLCARDLVGQRDMFVILGDEFYFASAHASFKDHVMSVRNLSAACLYHYENDLNKLRSNYLINQSKEVENGVQISSVIEKPISPLTNLMGLGSYYFTNEVFKFIEQTPVSDLRGEVELTDVIDRMASSHTVYGFKNTGYYLNVNTTEERNLANYLVRDQEFDEIGVSIVIPAFNEESSIAQVINDFIDLPKVKEVVVVDNNSADKTGFVAQSQGANVFLEKCQGYGAAIRRGISEAQQEIVVIVEADGSFSPNDLGKLLEYLKDCDMCIGTRTTRQLIEQGANMSMLARLVNVIFGKLIEVLWWGQEPRFTDVGCSYRALWKSSFEKAAPYIDSNGPEFSPDMMVAFLINRLRVIEIPVTYRRRLGGDSKHSADFKSLSVTALKMLKVILHKRFRYSNR